MTSLATSGRHLSKSEKTGKNAASDGFGSNFSGCSQSHMVYRRFWFVTQIDRQPPPPPTTTLGRHMSLKRQSALCYHIGLLYRLLMWSPWCGVWFRYVSNSPFRVGSQLFVVLRIHQAPLGTRLFIQECPPIGGIWRNECSIVNIMGAILLTSKHR